MALATRLSPLDLMRTPQPVLKALYDGVRRINEQRKRTSR